MYICINVVFQKIRARLQSNMIGNTLQLYFSKKLINRDGYFGVIIYVIHGYPLWVQLVGFRANLKLGNHGKPAIYIFQTIVHFYINVYPRNPRLIFIYQLSEFKDDISVESYILVFIGTTIFIAWLCQSMYLTSFNLISKTQIIFPFFAVQIVFY